ncbi:MAG: hydrogen gas-evolving membrane-bound hydrogenase subunit E [Oscillospiraceae bacterium]
MRTEYDVTEADGVADMIVKENLDKTTAENVVYSVVFNFRGYDTMGESFILVAAIYRLPGHPAQGEKREEGGVSEL